MDESYIKDEISSFEQEVKKDREKESFNSSVEEKGKIVDEIILFSSGNKKTFENIKTETISQNEFTHFDLLDGRRVYINPKNVDCFEVFSRKEVNSTN